MNRRAGAMLKAALSVAVVGLAAPAEMFYDKDGVKFEGTIRIVASEGGVRRDAVRVGKGRLAEYIVVAVE